MKPSLDVYAHKSLPIDFDNNVESDVVIKISIEE